jgi:hypothetical protein
MELSSCLVADSKAFALGACDNMVEIRKPLAKRGNFGLCRRWSFTALFRLCVAFRFFRRHWWLRAVAVCAFVSRQPLGEFGFFLGKFVDALLKTTAWCGMALLLGPLLFVLLHFFIAGSITTLGCARGRNSWRQTFATLGRVTR